jgi:hypothetical protein
MASADALSLGFAAFSSALLIKKPFSYQLFLSGVLWGLAIASKVTILLVSPFILVLIYTGWRFLFVKRLLYFGLATLLAFILACPYIWTDPIRLTKSILGNITRPGVSLGVFQAFFYLVDILSVPVFIISLIGAFFLLLQQQKRFFLAILITFLLIIFVLSRAGVFYDRYILPITIPVMLLFISGIRYISRVVHQFALYKIIWVIGIIILTGTNVLSYNQELEPLVNKTTNFADLINTVQSSQLDEILLPKTFLYDFAPYVSSSSFHQIAENTRQSMYYGESLHSFFESRKLSERAQQSMNAIFNNFNEDEQVLVSRMNILSLQRRGNLNIRLYSINTVLSRRFNTLTLEQAISSTTENSAIVIINPINIKIDKKKFIVHDFGQYTLLKSKKSF